MTPLDPLLGQAIYRYGQRLKGEGRKEFLAALAKCADLSAWEEGEFFPFPPPVLLARIDDFIFIGELDGEGRLHVKGVVKRFDPPIDVNM